MTSPVLSINIHYKMPLFLTYHHMAYAKIVEAKRRNGFLTSKNLIIKDLAVIK
jgi:hypothetical protein